MAEDATTQVFGLTKDVKNSNDAIENRRYITPTTKRHPTINNTQMGTTGGQCAGGPNCNCQCNGNCGYWYDDCGHQCSSRQCYTRQCSPIQCSTIQCSAYTDYHINTTPTNIANQRKLLKDLIKELIQNIHYHSN